MPQRNWFNHIATECSKFKTDLELTLEKYSSYLDPEIIDLVEEIINSSFISFSLVFPSIPVVHQELKIDNKKNFGGPGLSSLLRKHISLFIKLVELYNQNVSDENKLKIASSK